MLNFLDTFLDKITMYRLVLYELLVLLGIVLVVSFLGLLPFSFLSIALSALLFTFICYVTNKVFSFIFQTPANVESVYITALILTFVAKPIQSTHDVGFIFWLAVWSMSSKYIFALKKKHIFNPVAIAAVVCSIFLGQSITWWVGTGILAPFVFLLGFLIVRKIEREDLVISFFLSALITISVSVFLKNGNVLSVLQTTIFNSSLLFFGFVMLTEPLTTPPTKILRILYGIFVGFLFNPYLQIGWLFLTPELALFTGNIFSYLVSPKEKLLLKLKEKIQIGKDQMDFIFYLPQKFSFSPGQYMEWTLQHPQTDSRGNRRYFTLASSPTESTVRLGVKFYPRGSSYKKALLDFGENNTIIASQLAGDFTLPKNKKQKIVFLAGGIGITPFRSMIKFLTDTKETRDIILFYSNKIPSEIMYADVFTKAKEVGIRTMYTLTDTENIPQHWQGKVGRITSEMIAEEVPDLRERIFYLSGPHNMVEHFASVLQKVGVSPSRIKKDFFPGFA